MLGRKQTYKMILSAFSELSNDKKNFILCFTILQATGLLSRTSLLPLDGWGLAC
jgi:hypothetical protein